MLHPTVYNTSQICYQMGVRHAVLSPGSRNAPLLISFARHEGIEKLIIPDERSAGFIALGIAQETTFPVVLCCTSGTALLNYAPAVAEAFYREIPLVVLTADRPPELIDQRDGQTIRQFEALKNHVKKSVQLPLIQSEKEAKAYQNLLMEAFLTSTLRPKGPVHVNVPFKEPFYPDPDQKLIFEEIDAPVHRPAEEEPLPDVPNKPKMLLLIGQQNPGAYAEELIKQVADQIPVVRSPLNNLSHGFTYVDAFIKDQKELVPDVLITAGLSVLSKNLKNFIKNHTPSHHFHFDPSGVMVDTYRTSPQLLRTSLDRFLPSLINSETNTDYLHLWQNFDHKAGQSIKDFMASAPFSESKATWEILKRLPKEATLHLSNSMPVRFADLFGVPDGTRSFSNRGTSGIDGCTSTALGAALISKNLHLLITGDLGFLYDRNAFFHNYPCPHFRVVIMNNSGGGIFRLINGPSQLPELEHYFETRHKRTAEYICAENRMDYLTAASSAQLDEAWPAFMEPSAHAKVLEVFTDPVVNQRTYKELRNYIYEQTND